MGDVTAPRIQSCGQALLLHRAAGSHDQVGVDRFRWIEKNASIHFFLYKRLARKGRKRGEGTFLGRDRDGVFFYFRESLYLHGFHVTVLLDGDRPHFGMEEGGMAALPIPQKSKGVLRWGVYNGILDLNLNQDTICMEFALHDWVRSHPHPKGMLVG